MSQGEKDNQISQKLFFNSKAATPHQTRTGSSRKEKKVIVKHQYEDEYKDLIPQNSNDNIIDKKLKAKNCSGDTYDFKVKWKTEICHYWEVNGICKYGDNCAFAHGENELRNKKMSMSYKTKLCKRFFEIGYCPYGLRCQFSHKDYKKRQLSYLKLLLNFNNKDNSEVSMTKRPRLKTFEHLIPFDDSNGILGLKEEKFIEANNDHINSMDTKDNDKEDTEQRDRYLSV